MRTIDWDSTQQTPVDEEVKETYLDRARRSGYNSAHRAHKAQKPAKTDADILDKHYLKCDTDVKCTLSPEEYLAAFKAGASSAGIGKGRTLPPVEEPEQDQPPQQEQAVKDAVVLAMATNVSFRMHIDTNVPLQHAERVYQLATELKEYLEQIMHRP